VLYRSLFLCLLIITTLTTPANAMVGDDIYHDGPDPFCPARVVSAVSMRAHPATETDLGTDDVFAIKLASDTPKTVSGSLQVLSGNQPFKVSFANVALSPSPYTVTSGKDVLRSGTAYYSAPIYFALPRPMPVHAVWIYEILVDGKSADCGTLPLYHTAYKGTVLPVLTHEGGMSDEDARLHAPQHPPLAAEEKRIDFSDCATPLKEGEAVSLKQPQYPGGVALRTTTVLIKLALDAAGHVADASVLQSGGDKAFDLLALDSAANSRFNPRLFLCSSIPGFYVFRARFIGH
jgi:TonB family protein